MTFGQKTRTVHHWNGFNKNYYWTKLIYLGITKFNFPVIW